MTTYLLLGLLLIGLVGAIERQARRHIEPWASPTSRDPSSDRDWVRTRAELSAAPEPEDAAVRPAASQAAIDAPAPEAQPAGPAPSGMAVLDRGPGRLSPGQPARRESDNVRMTSDSRAA